MLSAGKLSGTLFLNTKKEVINEHHKELDNPCYCRCPCLGCLHLVVSSISGVIMSKKVKVKIPKHPKRIQGAYQGRKRDLRPLKEDKNVS